MLIEVKAGEPIKKASNPLAPGSGVAKNVSNVPRYLIVKGF